MTTPNGAPEWASGQSSPDVTMNEAIRRTEAGANFYKIVDKDLTAPPGSCADGEAYIVASSPTGAWVGHSGDVAVAVGVDAASGWYFRDPAEGVFAWVQDEDALYRCSAGSSPATWAVYTGPTPSLTLDDLTDVSVAGVTDGQVLTYDTNSPGGWKAETPASPAPAIQAVTSSATVTPTFADDMVTITAQAAALALANPTGSAVSGKGIIIRIKDNGTARAITYDTQYRAVGVTLPTTTVISKTLYLGMKYNAADTKWDVIAVAQEA